MSPSAILVIHNGTTKLVNIKNQDTVAKILDMIPDLIDRFKDNGNEKEKDELSEKEILDAVTKEENNQ